MGSREFLVALVDQGAWPLVVAALVGILLITQHKPIGELLDRDQNSHPNDRPPAGLVERFQQTLKKWLRAQPV